MRSSAPTTTSRWAVDGLPGPTDSWVTLAGLARETSTIRLGTMMTSATFRYPGPLAIAVAQVDQMSGGRVELGIGAGWYDAEHAAYAHPVPADRRAVRPARGPAGHPDRALGDAGGRDLLLRRHHALRRRLTRRCPSRPSSRTRRSSSAARAPKRTPALTARYADEFNLAVRRPRDTAEPSSPGSRAPARRSAATRPSLVYSIAHDHLLRVDERPRLQRRARAIGSVRRRPARERPRRHARRGRRARSAGTPSWARSGSTSRSSTCTTSTTSTCWRPRSCHTCDRCFLSEGLARRPRRSCTPVAGAWTGRGSPNGIRATTDEPVRPGSCQGSSR